MDTEVFLDTAYAIALANAKDEFHAKAVQLAKQLRTARTKLVTTRAVLLEIGNALAGQRFRAAAVQLLDALEADPSPMVCMDKRWLCIEHVPIRNGAWWIVFPLL